MNMKRQPEDEPQEKNQGLTIGKAIQFSLFGFMLLLLFIRYSNYVSSHSNIPPGGDVHTNTRTH
jgi:hypothetical protein